MKKLARPSYSTPRMSRGECTTAMRLWLETSSLRSAPTMDGEIERALRQALLWILEEDRLIVRSPPFILQGLMLTGYSVAAPQPSITRPILTRPVEIRELEKPLLSTRGSEYTVTVEGRVTDYDTRMTLPNATILVVTVAGSYEFIGGLFQVSFPAETVVNIKAEAPGYRTESRQLRPHY